MTSVNQEALDLIKKLYSKEEILEVIGAKDLTPYQKDPVGFLEKELGVEYLYDGLQQVCNSVRDNKITVVKSCNAPGKTYLASRLAAYFYLCFPDSQVICASAPPEENLKQGLFTEISNVYYKYRKTLFKNSEINVLKICDKIDSKTLANDEDINKGHFIVGRTIPASATPEKKKAAFSGKHAQYQLFIVDEADGCPDEIFEAIDGCLSGNHVRLLLLFNPRHKAGYVYNLITGEDKAHIITLCAFDHPNVLTGKPLIQAAVSRDKTIQRIYEWTEPLKEGEDIEADCFQVPEYLIGAVGISNSGKEYPPLPKGWRRIKDHSFSTIVLGEYPISEENCLISEVVYNGAVSRWKLFTAAHGNNAIQGIRPVLGMDVADEGGDNCAIAKMYGDFVLGFDQWKGIDIDKSTSKVAKTYCENDALQINIESDGIGAAIPPRIGRMYYYRCENTSCQYPNATYLDDGNSLCPSCGKEMARVHMDSKKVYVSAPSDKRCEFGKFHLIRDELAWMAAEWLKKNPSSMIPEDKELKQELLAYTWKEDPFSGKIKVSDKATIKKKIGRSDDKFAALRQCFFRPTVPHIRMVG